MSKKEEVFYMDTATQLFTNGVENYTSTYSQNEEFVSLKKNIGSGLVVDDLFIASDNVIIIKSLRVEAHDFKGLRVPNSSDRAINQTIPFRIVDADDENEILVDKQNFSVPRYEFDNPLDVLIKIPPSTSGKCKIIPYIPISPPLFSVGYRVSTRNVQPIYFGSLLTFIHFVTVLSSKDYIT